MGQKIDLTGCERIYLDTVIYIYLFEGQGQYADLAEDLLVKALEDDIEVVASELLLTELLVEPMREERSELVELYSELDNRWSNLRFAPKSREICVKAAELRVKYNLRTPDALHLATAIAQECDCFITADKGLGKVTEIRVIMI